MNNNEILEIIDEAYDYCEKLYSGMGNMVINIKNRDLDQIEQYLKNILEGFTWVVEVVTSSKQIYNEQIDLLSIQEKIKMFVEAYNNMDLLLLSDIVEYELMIQVEQLYKILSKIKSSY